MKIKDYYNSLNKKERFFFQLITLIALFSMIFTTVTLGLIGYKFVSLQINDLPIDMKIPQTSLKDVTGNLVNLSETTRKKKLLLLFKPECPACRMELANLQYISKQHPSTELHTVAISECAEEETRKFLTAYAVHFPVLIDPNRSVRKHYKFKGTPVLFLIDEDNTIRYGHVGYRGLEFDKMILEEFLRNSKVPIEVFAEEGNIH